MNKPLAWLGKDYDGLKTDLYFEVERNKLPYRLYESAIPLYTHPVKELTYEDGIEECAQRAEAYAYMSPNFTALAEELRAILRKAQE